MLPEAQWFFPSFGARGPCERLEREEYGHYNNRGIILSHTDHPS